jgi:large subunit ribosomal protein L18
MSSKKEQRLRRAAKARKRIAKQRIERLVVTRTNLHTYASVISADNSQVLASASTLTLGLKYGKGGNIAAATLVGKAIAEKAKQVGITKLAFDRSGYAYHGRVKALADAAREAGMQI